MTKESLQREKDGLIAYAHLKLDSGDFHAVADAAMDLREIEAKLSVLGTSVYLERHLEVLSPRSGVKD